MAVRRGSASERGSSLLPEGSLVVGAPMTVDEWLEEFGSLWLPDPAEASRELFEEAESVRGRDTAIRPLQKPV